MHVYLNEKERNHYIAQVEFIVVCISSLPFQDYWIRSLKFPVLIQRKFKCHFKNSHTSYLVDITKGPTLIFRIKLVPKVPKQAQFPSPKS